MTHTKQLSNELKGFELYNLLRYDNFMEQERKDDIEYGSGISHHDDLGSFYSWLDSLSWDEMKPLIEEYALEVAARKMENNK